LIIAEGGYLPEEQPKGASFVTPAPQALDKAGDETLRRVDAELASEETLLKRYHDTRDEAARDALVDRYLPFARGLARRFDGRGEALPDLIGVASVGLLKAIQGFDPGKGRSFEAYAAPTILGEIRRHFRDRCWAIHVPRGVRDLTPLVSRATETLFGKLGRAPTIQELSEELSVSVEDVLDALEASSAARPASLDERDRSATGDGPVLADRVGEVDHGYERVEGRVAIESRIGDLSDRTKQVLRMRFEEDLTQSEIARRIGVSQMQVSRILRRAFSQLRGE
jgi:RNA polymerase sigma-B factor